MKTLKDRYLDAVVPRDPGPRPRAGYSLWRRYWAALTGTRLPAKPALHPEKRHYGAARRRVLLASLGGALVAVAGGTLFISAVQAPHTTPEPGPSLSPPQGTQAPPPEPIAVTRDLVIPPTASGVGIDLANGQVSAAGTGDIGFYYDGGWMYVDEPSSTVATVDVTKSTVSYLTCLNTLEDQLANLPRYRPTAPPPPEHPYTGQGLCVGTPTGGMAFLKLTGPVGAGKPLHLRETYWP